MPYSRALADRVRGMLPDRPPLVEKEMFGGIAFLIGGNMAVGVHRDDLIVRVDPLQTERFLAEPGAKPFDVFPSRGPPAGWLLVSLAGHRDDPSLRSWIARGVAYATSLPKKAVKPKARR